jgi:putative membrane protein
MNDEELVETLRQTDQAAAMIGRPDQKSLDADPAALRIRALSPQSRSELRAEALRKATLLRDELRRRRAFSPPWFPAPLPQRTLPKKCRVAKESGRHHLQLRNNYRLYPLPRSHSDALTVCSGIARWSRPIKRGTMPVHPQRICTMQLSKSLLFLAFAGMSGSAFAADGDAKSPAAPVFVEKAAQGGMTEVAMGKLALAKSNDADIRKFAQRMVTDHGKANSELATIAKAKGLEAPKKLDTPHAAMVEELEAKEGAGFDEAYSMHMNMDHSKAINLFESASSSEDADIAGFARKTLPTLKEHKVMAEKLPSKSKM